MLYGISKHSITPPPNEVLNDFMEEDVNFCSFFYVIRKRDWARLKNIQKMIVLDDVALYRIRRSP